MVDSVFSNAFSRRSRLPVDEVKPEHQAIHEELEKWGAWNRDRRKRRSTCGSIEGNYRIRSRDWHYPEMEEMMPHIVNPRMVVLDKAILQMPEQHRAFLRSYYVNKTPPEIVCRVQHVQRADFARWMDHARSMVMNLLRRGGE